MASLDLGRLREAPLSVVFGELAKTKPVVFVNHDPTVKADAELARDIANTFRGFGVDATTYAEFSRSFGETPGVPVEKIDAEIRGRVDIVIEVVSMNRVKRNEGMHEAVAKVARDESMEVGEGKTRVFPVTHETESASEIARNWRIPGKVPQIGTWNGRENLTKFFCLGLIFAGPNIRRTDRKAVR